MSKNIKHLTDEQYRITNNMELNPVLEHIGIKKMLVYIIVFVITLFFFMKQNMTQDQVSLLFINQFQFLVNQLIIHFL